MSQIQFNSPQSTSRRRSRRPLLTAAIAGVLLLALALFCVNRAYHVGHADGIAAQQSATAQSLQALSDAVSAKATFATQLQQLMANVPTTLSAEGIERYLANLDQLLAQTTDSEIKTVLGTYRQSWVTLQETYVTGDQTAIAAALANVHLVAADTAQQITTIFNQNIESAAEALQN